MNKKGIKVISVAIIIILAMGYGIYKYNEKQTYKNLVGTANKFMDSGKYDKAIDLFKKSQSYKNDISVENSIKLANSLKSVKAKYDEATNLMNQKKYLEAIDEFDKITKKEDDKLYNDAQKMIDECKKEFVKQDLELANSSIKNNKYDEANKYIESILKIDNNNSNAKKLKQTIEKSSKAKKSVKVTSEEDKKQPKNITDGQILQLINNANELLRNIFSSECFDLNKKHWEGNNGFYEFKTNYNSPQKISKYLNKCWTKNQANSLSKMYLFKYVDNEYCIEEGNSGVTPLILQYKIISRKEKGNTIDLMIEDRVSEENHIYKLPAKIKFEDGKWLVENWQWE